ncbi:MAG: hypothetical protein GY925_27510, partial [Actinomycetia bacterium]|nr:hypothetical protein [Actinomycetes bacterium]
MTPTVDLLVNAAPTISTIPRSRFRRRVTADAYTAMGLLADHLLAELQAGRTDELDAVLTEAEHLVQSDYQPNIHTVGTGLIEGLHHGVSHLQDSVEPLLANRLPPRCRTLWEESRALHRDIAIWRSST